MSVNHDDKQVVIGLLKQFHPFSDLKEEGVYTKLLEFDIAYLFEVCQELLLTDEKMRKVIARALMKVDSKRALPMILPLLNDPNSDIRWYVCGLLSQYGDKRAVKPLTALLQDPDPNVRHIATFALGKIGDESVLPALEWIKQNDKGVDHEGRPISEMASEAIESISTQQVGRSN